MLENSFPITNFSNEKHWINLKKGLYFFPLFSFCSRTTLPAPGHSEVNLCSVLSLGKDLSKITMPVMFNEPLSFLQRVAEYMEYAKLLKQASLETTPLARLQVLAKLIFHRGARFINKLSLEIVLKFTRKWEKKKLKFLQTYWVFSGSGWNENFTIVTLGTVIWEKSFLKFSWNFLIPFA